MSIVLSEKLSFWVEEKIDIENLQITESDISIWTATYNLTKSGIPSWFALIFSDSSWGKIKIIKNVKFTIN